jgi:5-methylcytosine-specific restriction endonuclease McrA
MAINPKLRRQISERDTFRCCYCLTTEENSGIRMHIDHIIPEAIGGKTTIENLCLTCFTCNVNKGALHEATDPDTGEEAPLFHPLQQHWYEHHGIGRFEIKLIKVKNT